MNSKIYLTAFTIGLVIIWLTAVNSVHFAQENKSKNPKSETPENIPFVDRDGDGINDVFQSKLGLKFSTKQKSMKPIDISEQTNNKEQLFNKYMEDTINEKLNSDKENLVDTPIKKLLQKQFRAFDRDGDGKPDIGTIEEIRKYMNEVHQWQQQMHQRMKDGLPPIKDEDEDGIPDDLPARLQWQNWFNNNNKPDDK